MWFQLQIPFARADPEKAVKATIVETFEFTRVLPTRDRNAARVFIAGFIAGKCG